MLAMELRASNVCARLILGIQSTPKAVIFLLANKSSKSLFWAGYRKLISLPPSFIRSASFCWGGRTWYGQINGLSNAQWIIWYAFVYCKWKDYINSFLHNCTLREKIVVSDKISSIKMLNNSVHFTTFDDVIHVHLIYIFNLIHWNA